MTIEKNICDAIDIIVQQAISQASYDKTIKAVISECVDSSTGQYTVKYQDAIFYAYSQSTSTTYTNGTSVWVLVPGNDMSQTKTILGTVTKLGEDYVTVVEDEDSYEINGINCIESSTTEYGLKSYLPDSSSAEFLVTGGTDNSVVASVAASVTTITGAVGSNSIVDIENNNISATSNEESLTLVVEEGNSNIITLYSRDAGINLIGLDTVAVEQYIKSSNYIFCAMNARTELPIEQQTQGNYGIIFALDFLDTSTGNSITRYYTIDVDNMTGNPYKFINAAYQYAIFSIDSENFIDINYISLFCYNFPYSKDEDECVEDIFLSGFELYGANYIEEDENGYSLTIKTPSGRYFSTSAISSDTRSLVADFRVNGNSVTSGLTYYWFIENAGISTRSMYYNKYGGQGWKCLNDYEVVSSSDDGSTDVIEWLNGEDTYVVTKSDLYTTSTTYKLVVIYAGAAISKTVEVINLDATYTLSIESDLGTQFYYNQGYPTLQCLVNGKDDDNLIFSWSVTDINGSYSSLAETTAANVAYEELLEQYNQLLEDIESGQALKSASEEELKSLETQLAAYDTATRVNGNTIYHLNVNTITTSSTYKCTVYSDDIYIGTASIVLYNTLETEGTYSLILNNGSYTYKYDESGVSPASDSLSSPIAISELSFTVYDNLGNELSEDVINHCDIQWVVPNGNSMIEIPSDYTPTATANGYDYYTGLITLAYTIADIYDASKVNNDIKLIVAYQDLILTATTNLTFIKEGESGTNGTEFTCKIVPNNSSFSDYPLVTEYSNGSYEWNYTPVTSGVYFKIQLYHNEALIFDGTSSGSSEEGKIVSIAWSVLSNKYTATRSDISDFSIDGLSGEVTFNGYTGSKVGLTTTAGYPVNIIKATVKYDDVTYYVTLPVLTAFVTDSNYTVGLTKNTGFLYSIYTTDGQSPQYANAKPFDIITTREIDGYTEDVSELTNEYKVDYSWEYLGSIYSNTSSRYIEEVHLSQNVSYEGDLANNQMAIKPDDTFDGECLSNAIEVIITNAATEVARIHIPVHMYLNRYGQAALNSWDGNSISISEDGGYILAPQVGAGYKEDDNSFTGVLMGKVKEGGSDDEETGLFGYYQGTRTIFLNAQTGSAYFGAAGKGQIIIDPTSDIAQIYSGNYSTTDGTGLLIDLTTPEIRYGSGNFIVDADGHVYMTGATVEGYSTTEDTEIVRKSSVVDVTTYYAEGTSQTTAPTSGWSLSQPAVRAGYYIWAHTIVTYGDDSQTETYMCLTGNEGVGIASIEEYYLTTADTSAPSTSASGWSTSLDNLTFDSTYKYLWNYEAIIYTDGNIQNTTPVIISVYAVDGATGRGITSITNYYAVSTLATISPTSGWTTNPSNAVITSTNKYLWNYEVIVYTDGTSETTTAAVVGAYGDTGVSLYTWVKFASDVEGSDMSDDPDGMDYIGLSYNNTSMTESTNPSDYTWSLFKGSDGVDGESGYTWIKFADDATGINMSDSPTDKYYIGFAYNKTTQDESDDPSDYDWTLFRGSNGVDGTGVNIKGTAYTGQTATITVSGETLTIVSSSKATVTTVVDNMNETSYIVSLTNGSLVDSTADEETLVIDTDGYVIGLSDYLLYEDEALTIQIVDPEESDAYLVDGYLFVWSGTENYFTCVGLIQGVGISYVTEYYGVSNDTSIQPTNWSSVPNSTYSTMSSTNKYLWNYEQITYSDGSTTETNSVIIGNYAEDGADGSSIESIIEYYGVSSVVGKQPSSWTTDPSTTVATMTATNKYLWNYEVIAYTGGTSGSKTTTTDPVIIGVYGDDGIGIESIVAYYIAGDSNTNAPSFTESSLSNWSTDVKSVTVSETQYLWMAYLFIYTDGSKTYAQPACLTDAALKSYVETYVEKTNTLESTVNGISGELTTLTTTVGEYFTTTDEKIAELTLNAEEFTTKLSNITETVQSDGRNYCLLSGDYYLDSETGWHWINPPSSVDGSSEVVSATSTTITLTTDPTQAYSVYSTINEDLYNADAEIENKDSMSTSNLDRLYIVGLNNSSVTGSISEDSDGTIITFATGVDLSGNYLVTATYDGYTRITVKARTLGHYASISLSENLESGATYTLTMKLRMSVKKIFNIYAISSNSTRIQTIASVPGTDYSANTWITIEETFTVDSGTTYDEIGFDLYEAYAGTSGTIDVQWIKLEKGSIATDWTCAPEDISVAAVQSIVSQTASSWSVQLQQVEESLGNYATKAELALILDTDTGEATLSASATYITLSATNKLRITSGNFTIDSSGNVTMQGKVTATSGYIGNGTSGFTITSTAIYNGKSSLTASSTGVYIGTDGISLGTSSTFKVTKDGALTATSATITGKVTATSGYIGSSSSNGFTIALNSDINKYCIYYNKSTFDSTNSGIYIGPDGISLGIYSNNYGSSPFQVDSSGTLTVRNAIISGTITAGSGSTIGGWTLSSTQIYKQSTTSTAYQVVLNAPSSPSSSTKAFYIQTGTYSSSTYSWGDYLFYVRYDGYLYAANGGKLGSWTIGSGTSGAIYYGSSSFGNSSGMYFGTSGLSLGSAFKVTSAGVLTATSANITGTITASEGIIGGFTIGSSALYNGTSSMSSTTAGTYIGTSGIRQYASSSAYVNIQNGIITAVGASISGTITASGGTIGGFTIGDSAIYETKLSLGSHYNGVYLGTDGIALGAYSSTYGSSPFEVTSAGALTARSGTIGGWTITDVKIYGGDADEGVAVMQQPTSSTKYVFAAGGTSHSSYEDCPFRVTKAGKLYSQGAVLTHVLVRPETAYTTSYTGRVLQVQNVAEDDWSSSTDSNVLLACGVDDTSAYLRSMPVYDRTSSGSANVHVTSSGTLCRYSSSSIRYKNTVNYFYNKNNASIEGLNKQAVTVSLEDFQNDYRGIFEIPVVQFHYNEGYVTGEPNYDYNQYVTGFIAEDVEKILPKCATYTEDGQIEAWNHMQMIPRMVAAIQENNFRIIRLEKELEEAYNTIKEIKGE